MSFCPVQRTAIQEAKVNSYRATEQHVDDNIEIIAVIPAFKVTFDNIKTNIAAILDAAEQKAASLTGITAGKSDARETLVKRAAIIAGLIYTYAADIGDKTLMEEMNLTESKIRRNRDDELIPLARMIHNRANANLDALKDYNINADKLSDLQTAIDNFTAAAPKPRTAVSNRKTTNINIAAKIRDTDKLLAKFDKQIESLAEDHSDFVNTYRSTRIIVDPPTRARKKMDSDHNEQHKQNFQF